MGPRAHLFRTSFLLLFLELALLRWVGAYVPFASFFTHHVLLGALLGVCLGFFLTGRPERLLRAAPLVLLATLGTGAAFHLLAAEGLLGVHVEDPARPDRLFFGTLWPSEQPRRLALPIEGTLLSIFLGTAAVTAGLGQRLGALFERTPDRLGGYAAHLAGCVVGSLAFAGLASTGAPAALWFLPALALLAFEVGARAALPLTLCAALLFALDRPADGWERRWSPYNRIDLEPVQELVFANGIGHQQIVDRGHAGQAYALPYQLRDAPGRVPVIGAGTGNDVAVALASGAEQVDAVELDPVLAQLGRERHPDRPYDDPRVRLVIGDGRAFLERTQARYDLIVYGLVDSLTLHSSYGSVRLESYLFTREALQAARECLAPGGRLAITNYLRSGWLVSRLDALLEEVFGAPPAVYSLPQRTRITVDGEVDRALTVLVAGGAPLGAIRLGGDLLTPVEVERADLAVPTDDWPYPYLRRRAVPAQNLRALGLLVLASLVAMALARAPVVRGLDRHFFFLGVGFALIETTSVSRLAAVLGTTWQVHAGVVSGVLLASLVGTAFAAWRPRLRRVPLYGLLALTLAVAGRVDARSLLSVPPALAAGLLLVPLICSGAIFALSLRATDSASRALGSNTAGVLLGVALEALTVVTGLRGMVAVVAAAYVLSLPRRA